MKRGPATSVDTGLYKCKNCPHVLDAHGLYPGKGSSFTRKCEGFVEGRLCECVGWEDVVDD